jgi:hypothetical protein
VAAVVVEADLAGPLRERLVRAEAPVGRDVDGRFVVLDDLGVDDLLLRLRGLRGRGRGLSPRPFWLYMMGYI